MTDPIIHYATRKELDEVTWKDCTARLERMDDAFFMLTLTQSGGRDLIVSLQADHASGRLDAWIEEEPQPEE